jgi:hypothetical protein
MEYETSEEQMDCNSREEEDKSTSEVKSTCENFMDIYSRFNNK